jgi:hypothetical protein
MSAAGDNDIGEATLAGILASTGVAVSQEEIAPIARALSRIDAAARVLLRSSFDDTTESYFRLLEDDDGGARA